MKNFQFVTLPEYSASSSRWNVQIYLSGVQYKLNVSWNSQMEGWVLCISDTPVSDKTEETDTAKEASNKWAFRTMLFPQLIPGAACKVEASTITTEMKVTKTKFSGDNRLGDFAIDIEAEVLA
ncbi:hypothetical protein ACYULU_15835 [Breznakiellaceae bacterium SP9]